MSKQRRKKDFDDLKFNDDFMFGKVMEDPIRSRYYQSTIDTDFMKRNSTYKELPESKVLFICTFDPFGKGKSRYTKGPEEPVCLHHRGRSCGRTDRQA